MEYIMSLYTDKEYLMSVSSRLPLFKRKGPDLYNFRCPFCGDSKKNKLKARGYIYRKKSNLFYTCHNCGIQISFGNFLKSIDNNLYSKYQLDRYKNESSSNVRAPDFSMAQEKPIFNKKINLPSILSLHPNHPARVFIEKRKLPHDKISNLFYAEDYAKFVDEIYPENNKGLHEKDERIVIPFYDEKKILWGFQGRTISNSPVRYITITLNETSKKVYGLDTVDLSKKIYVVEGPFDSMFLQNSIAMMDASLYRAKLLVGDHDYVFIFDNENRNKDVCKQMKKTIEMGYPVCIWPSYIEEKDINDMIIGGKSPSVIQSIIDNNTYQDVRAKLEFENWKKI